MINDTGLVSLRALGDGGSRQRALLPSKPFVSVQSFHAFSLGPSDIGHRECSHKSLGTFNVSEPIDNSTPHCVYLEIFVQTLSLSLSRSL